MTTSPLLNGTRVASITVLTLLTTAVTTALVGAAIAGLGGPTGRAGAPGVPASEPMLRAAAISTPAPRPTSPRPLRFTWTAARITAAELGSSWHAGCPVPPAELRVVTFTHWDFSGGVDTGTIVLHRDVVKRARAVFRTMFERRFLLRRVEPVSRYDGSDDRSMAADNTSAFNCRKAVAAGRPTWSRHAYGRAIDVNPVENPYLFRGEVLPPAGTRFTGRARARPGLVRRGDPIQVAFADAGFRWGGTFSNPDYQHFDR